jgi:hypothetical protein
MHSLGAKEMLIQSHKNKIVTVTVVFIGDCAGLFE